MRGSNRKVWRTGWPYNQSLSTYSRKGIEELRLRSCDRALVDAAANRPTPSLPQAHVHRSESLWKLHVCFSKSFWKRICADIAPSYLRSNIHLVRNPKESREGVLIAGLAVGGKSVEADDGATQRAEKRDAVRDE